jgi:hypothetical protein
MHRPSGGALHLSGRENVFREQTLWAPFMNVTRFERAILLVREHKRKGLAIGRIHDFYDTKGKSGADAIYPIRELLL